MSAAHTELPLVLVVDDKKNMVRLMAKVLRAADIRVEVDDQDAKLGYKIREAEVQKVPYMLVVGNDEVEAGTVSVRRHGEGDLGKLVPEELISRMHQEIEEKR